MSTLFRPQRARDTTEEELEKLLKRYLTLYLMIKYDGVRAIVRGGVVYGKSMLPITNQYIQQRYGKAEYEGKEFEIIVTTDGVYNPVTCCAETVSFTNSDYQEREHICVLLDDHNLGETNFDLRYSHLEDFANKTLGFIVPECEVVNSLDEIWEFENKHLTKDHEGIIIRNPFLPYKEGASSKEGELLRLKRYIAEEAIIVEVGAAFANVNTAEINALGYTERSSKAEGKVQKQEIGTLICRTVKDIHDPWSGRLIVKKDSLCIVAPGAMTKDEKIALYQDKDNLRGKMISFKSFPKGTKNKPRFATFQHFVPVFDQP